MSVIYKLYLTAQTLIALFAAYLLVRGVYAIIHDRNNTKIGIACFEETTKGYNFESIKIGSQTWDEAKDKFLNQFSTSDRYQLKEALSSKCPRVFDTFSHSVYFNNVLYPFSYSFDSWAYRIASEISAALAAMLGLFVSMKWLFWLMKKDEPVKARLDKSS